MQGGHKAWQECRESEAGWEGRFAAGSHGASLQGWEEGIRNSTRVPGAALPASRLQGYYVCHCHTSGCCPSTGPLLELTLLSHLSTTTY